MRRPHLVIIFIIFGLILIACDSGPQPTLPPDIIPATAMPTAPSTSVAQIEPTTTPSPVPATTNAPTLTAISLPTAAPTATPTNTPRPTATAPRVPPTLTPTEPPPTPPPNAQPHVMRLIVSPDNPSQLFALMSDRRNLSRSDDGGQSWTRITPLEALRSGSQGIGMDYRNPQTLYLTTDAQILRSGDRGRTWTPINNPRAQGITVSFDDPKVLWTATTAGRDLAVQRSDDGGQTWRAASIGFFGYFLAGPILIDPQDSNTLYAVADGIRGGEYLYRGTRAGAWTNMPLPNVVFGYCCFVGIGLAWSTNSRTLYVGSWNGKLYGSANSKEPDVTKVTWQMVSDFGAQVIVSALAHSVPGETLYVTLFDLKTNQAKLLKSNDGGASWQELKMP